MSTIQQFFVNERIVLHLFQLQHYPLLKKIYLLFLLIQGYSITQTIVKRGIVVTQRHDY